MKQQILDDVQAIWRNFRYGGGAILVAGCLIGLILGAIF